MNTAQSQQRLRATGNPIRGFNYLYGYATITNVKLNNFGIVARSEMKINFHFSRFAR